MAVYYNNLGTDYEQPRPARTHSDSYDQLHGTPYPRLTQTVRG